MVQQHQDEPIDAYFIRKLRATHHNLPEASEAEKVHFLSLGLQNNFLKSIALETYTSVRDLQNKLHSLEKSNDLVKKREFVKRSQALQVMKEQGQQNNPPKLQNLTQQEPRIYTSNSQYSSFQSYVSTYSQTPGFQHQGCKSSSSK